MAAAQGPLRRWKRFFPTFETIDAAIVACDPAGALGQEAQCAEVLRRAKADVVELLCDAPDAVAEEFCRILDDIMIDYLITLKAVPVSPTALASTDLAGAVAALGEGHECERVRDLARGLVHGWRKSVESDLARGLVHGWRKSVESDLAEARARVEELGKLFDDRDLVAHELSRPRASVVGSQASSTGRADADDRGKKRPVNNAPPLSCSLTKIGRDNSAAIIDRTKKTPAAVHGNGCVKKSQASGAPPCRAKTTIVGEMKPSPPAVHGNSGGGDHAGMIDEKMAATKRKLREGYQEAADAKRQRRIQVIAPPKMPEQRPAAAQKRMHPILRERSRARCGVPAAAKRSLMPAFRRTD